AYARFVRRHTTMPRLKSIALLICLAELTACHHRALVVYDSYIVACPDTTHPIGPSSSLRISRSPTRDPSAPRGMGRLVALFTWSSDSLALNTPPPRARFTLRSFRLHFDSHGYALTTDTAGVVSGDSLVSMIILSASEGSYRLEVFPFGAAGLDTSFVIRNE